MQGMNRNEDHDAMYANGHPDVGFDQDASVHLKDVRSHIAALKVYTHECSSSPSVRSSVTSGGMYLSTGERRLWQGVCWPDLEPQRKVYALAEVLWAVDRRGRQALSPGWRSKQLWLPGI